MQSTNNASTCAAGNVNLLYVSIVTVECSICSDIICMNNNTI